MEDDGLRFRFRAGGIPPELEKDSVFQQWWRGELTSPLKEQNEQRRSNNREGGNTECIVDLNL